MRKPIAPSRSAVRVLPEGPETFFRLSPAGQVKAQCFAVRRGEIKDRIDPKFVLYGGHQTLKGLTIAALGNLVVSEPEYGSAKRAIPMKSPDDVKYIRITDFGDDGIAPGHEFVTAEEIENKYRLEENDVLFARSGATAGKTFIYTKDIGPAIFAGYCIRFRFNPKKALPWYVYFYTKTPRYQAWVRSMQRPAGQPNINKEEFKSFTIPVVAPDLQAKLVEELQAARNARYNKLAQADALIKGIDSFVLGEMGLETPKPDGRAVFAVRLYELKKRCEENATRLDPHYNTPNFWRLIREIKEIQSESLGKVARFSDFQWNPGTCNSEFFQYIEIAGIDVLTGDITATTTPVAEAPSRARMLIKTGDILVSLTRPHRGAIGVVPKNLDASVASTGFAVISEIKDKRFSPDYLLAILRTSICLQQMLQRSSGGNYPAITEPELKQITVPLTNENVQKRIVSEIANRKEQVQRIRAEAAALWAKAIENFEGKLLFQGAKS